MRIKAAVFYKPNTPFQIETLDLAEPRSGEVLVKVGAVGVCHSDWHVMTGATPHPAPCVVGHEGAGTVETVGPGVNRVRVGDHVALNWAPNCGTCFYCMNGRPSLCATYVGPIWAGTMMDGTTRLSIAALIGCAVTTGVGAVLNTARVKKGSSVAVYCSSLRSDRFSSGG